jgi:hypothetical protein
MSFKTTVLIRWKQTASWDSDADERNFEACAAILIDLGNFLAFTFCRTIHKRLRHLQACGLQVLKACLD